MKQLVILSWLGILIFMGLPWPPLQHQLHAQAPLSAQEEDTANEGFSSRPTQQADPAPQEKLPSEEAELLEHLEMLEMLELLEEMEFYGVIDNLTKEKPEMEIRP